MATITYKCDTCKRELEVIRNTKGLEIIDRCTITQGCRGHLYKIDEHLDYIRGSTPEPVAGLGDWSQRKILYNHTQNVAKSTWTITHNLGTLPAVSVFVDKPQIENLSNREEILPSDIIVVDPNTVQLNFDRSWSGIAQLVARTSSNNIVTTTTTTNEPITITNNSELTIATKSALFPTEQIGIEFIYSTITGIPLTHTYVFNSTPTDNSPWSDYTRIIIGGKNYTTRSMSIQISEMIEGIIPNGASFQFGNITKISNTGSVVATLQANDVVILLASEQGETFDKNRKQFVDIKSNLTSNLIYTDNELFTDIHNVNNVYPHIQSAK